MSNSTSATPPYQGPNGTVRTAAQGPYNRSMMAFTQSERGKTNKLYALFHILVTSKRSSVISPCFTRIIYTKELFARWGTFLRKGHLPAGKTEQFVFVCYGWLLLKLPHQDIDQMWVFNYNRHFLKHVLKGDACLFQSVKHVKDTWGWWSALSAKLSDSHNSPNHRTLHRLCFISLLGAWGGKRLPSLSPVTWVTLKMIWIWAVSPKIRSLAKEPAHPE